MYYKLNSKTKPEDGLDCSGLVKYIFNQVKTKCNRDYYKIWFTGGGSIELKEAILRLEPSANFMKDALFTNVNGNKRIALSQWR